MVDQTKIMLSQLQTVVELKSELSLAIITDMFYPLKHPHKHRYVFPFVTMTVNDKKDCIFGPIELPNLGFQFYFLLGYFSNTL